jgi:RHS repeat-associated protein
LAEYIAGAAPFLPTREYGYRGGELLVTMSSGDDLRLLKFLHKLYIGALGRSPNTTEQQQGMDSLTAAGAQSQAQLLAAAQAIAQSLFDSTEYAQRSRTDAQFVTDLYWAYPQRAPDSGGYQAWLNAVPVYGRAAVRDGFAYSGEFSGLVSRIYGIATDDNQRTLLFVYKLYSALGRDPSSSELSQGIDRLNAAALQGQNQVIAEAQAFAREIFTSTEYANRNRSDRDFVMDLYLATVQRAPDSSGWDAWTAAVASAGRPAVREGFLAGGEFQYLAGTLYREEFWLVNDRLGTPRMIVDKSGSLAGVKRHDYLPFGEELYAGIGGRTTQQGYTGDSVRQHFTGYEADGETGLNFAQARYQSPVQGRFTSVDPLMASASVVEPQSLNRYSYVQNDPVNAVDPTGMSLADMGVLQTSDPAEAQSAQDLALRRFQISINDDYAASHGGTVSYSGNHATLDKLSSGSVVATVNIYGHFEDVWGNPNYSAMANALWGLARTGYRFDGPTASPVQSQFRNFLAGVIDNGVGPPPILGWSLGRVIRLGADAIAKDYADEDSTAYYVGSWVPDAVAAVAGGEAGLVDEAGLRLGGKLALDDAHHTFPVVGKLSHFQLTLYQKGIKGSHWITRVPLPLRRFPQRARTLLKF